MSALGPYSAFILAAFGATGLVFFAMIAGSLLALRAAKGQLKGAEAALAGQPDEASKVEP